MNFDKGPILHCDQADIRKLRSHLRGAIDDLCYEDKDELTTQFGFEDYRGEVRKLVFKQINAAKRVLKVFPNGAVFAPSLISGLAGIWGNDFAESRMSVVVGNTVIDKTFARAKKLDKLTISPVHALCLVLPEKRNLWVRLTKPNRDTRGRRTVERLTSFAPLYEGLSAKEQAKALIQAAKAFEAADGKYLWLFGFDAEKPPSPSRVVAVSTDNANADNDPAIRRWLNVFAAILGEIATIERSMAVFVKSLQARTKVIKADESRWESIVRAQESRDRLARVQKRLDAKNFKDASKEAIGGMLALLPKSKGIDAHHRSVMEMPHYDAPSLRQALLQRRAFENQDEVLRIFSGILQKLNETFYAQAWDAFHCDPKKAKKEMDARRTKYFQEQHLSKYEERAEAILAQTTRLRSNSSLTAGQVRLLRAISAIYNNQPLIATCRYGKDFRSPALLEKNNEFRWNAQATEPVHSVLSTVAKIKSNALQELLSPPSLYWTHGDLHFHNILIDLGDLDDPLFKLIDANIDKSGRDIAADFSKLLQSCDALGDFIHEGLFEIRAFLPPLTDLTRLWKIDLKVGSGTITDVLSGGASGAEVFRYLKTEEQLKDYRHIANSFAKLTNDHITALKTDARWQTRAVFGLAMNLLTSPAFFIERNPEMALAFAVSGAMVLTEWCHRKDVSVELNEAGYTLTTTKENGYS